MRLGKSAKAANEPWAAWMSPTEPAQPSVRVPAVPPRPVVDQTMPEAPNRVRCRSCSKWISLGDDPSQTLAEMWPAWIEEWRERTGERWDAPAPARPEHPGKVCCTGCGRWIDLGSDPQERLRREHLDYVDELQERSDARWRSSPALMIAAAFEASQAAELRAEEREKREAEERRDEAKSRRITLLIEHGLHPFAAHAQAEREFAEFEAART